MFRWIQVSEEES
jgi:hypothetical protein